MNIVTLKTAVFAALAAGSLTGVWLAGGADSTANKLILQVENKVHDTLPTKAEKRFDEIGWAKDIRDAERLAKKTRRPILLFTHDGRIGTARC